MVETFSLIALIPLLLAFSLLAGLGRRAGGFLSNRGFASQDLAFERSYLFPAGRILFGILLVIQSGLELWAWPSESFGELRWWAQSFEFFAGWMILVGFGTQYALSYLAVFSFIHIRTFLDTALIEIEVSAQLAILLLLVQAGSRVSVDALLMRDLRVPNLFLLYSTRQSFLDAALARFLALLAFWAMSLASLALHLGERGWQTGAVGPLVFSDPFLSRLGTTLSSLFAEYPELMNVFRLPIYVQMIWFATIVPFALLGGWWRWFTILWGFLFFLGSLLVLQLQFLAPVELILWSLIFWPVLSRQTVVGQTTFLPSPNRLVVAVFFHGLLSIGVFLISAPPQVLSVPNPLSEIGLYKVAAPQGVRPVNVFNDQDLRMKENWFTVETDGGALVPIFNRDGTRGSLAGVNSIYLGSMVRFAREEIDSTGCGLDRHQEKAELAVEKWRAVAGIRGQQSYIVRQFRRVSPTIADVDAGSYQYGPAEIVCARTYVLR